jgi:hypothetical protein
MHRVHDISQNIAGYFSIEYNAASVMQFEVSDRFHAQDKRA